MLIQYTVFPCLFKSQNVHVKMTCPWTKQHKQMHMFQVHYSQPWLANQNFKETTPKVVLSIVHINTV